MIVQACYEGRSVPVLRIPVNTIDGTMHNQRVDEMEDTLLVSGLTTTCQGEGRGGYRQVKGPFSESPIRNRMQSDKKEQGKKGGGIPSEVSVCLRCRPIS
jgi:hypothetical protein